MMPNHVVVPPESNGSAFLSSSSCVETWSDSTIHDNLSIQYDINASALSVDVTGSYVVLGARKGLYIIDLESPFQPARTLHHQSKWEVGVVKCNPCHSHKGRIASTSNQNTLVWNIGPDGNASQALFATLRAHTRVVSDISWSPTAPTILATCSADSYTHIWDIRTPQKPVQSFCAYSVGATQVQWNRVNHTTLATTHDGNVRVWDTRSKEKAPVVLITAHMQKIYGLDWSPNRECQLVTCSEDKTVKMWDINNPRTGQGSLTTGAPVWRAQYTPFGDGLVTISHRLDNTLRLWSLSSDESSTSMGVQVHAFSGHSDFVRGFDWRVHQGKDHFQLVSWSKSQQLRLWRVEPQHLEACGHVSLDSGVFKKSEMYPTESAALPLGSKYDLSALKNDFVPIKVPSDALPLSLHGMSLENNSSSNSAAGGNLVAEMRFAEENNTMLSTALQFNLDPVVQLADYHHHNDNNFSSTSNRNTTTWKTSSSHISGVPAAAVNNGVVPGPSEIPHQAEILPCPRISGGCFGGINVLVVFNSRAAVGQVGYKSRKVAALPRTYAGLRKLKVRNAENRLQHGRSCESSVVNVAVNSGQSSLDEHSSEEFDRVQREWGNVGGMGAGVDDIDEFGNVKSMDSLLPEMVDLGIKSRLLDDTSSSTDLLQEDHNNNSANAALGATPNSGPSSVLNEYFGGHSRNLLPINHPDHILTSDSSQTLNSPHYSNSSKKIDRKSRAPKIQSAFCLSVTLLDVSSLAGVDRSLAFHYSLGWIKSNNKLLWKTNEASGGGGAASGDTMMMMDTTTTSTSNTSSLNVSRRLLSSKTRKRQSEQHAQHPEQQQQQQQNPHEKGVNMMMMMPTMPLTSIDDLYLPRPGSCTPVDSTEKSIHSKDDITAIMLKNKVPPHLPDLTTPLDASSYSMKRKRTCSVPSFVVSIPNEEDPSLTSVCYHNAEAAVEVRRLDLAQIWKLLALSTEEKVMIPLSNTSLSKTRNLRPWIHHPLGRSLVKKVFSHFEKLGDVQTLSTITCVLGSQKLAFLQNKPRTKHNSHFNNMLLQFGGEGHEKQHLSGNVSSLPGHKRTKSDESFRILADVHHHHPTGGNHHPTNPPLSRKTMSFANLEKSYDHVTPTTTTFTLGAIPRSNKLSTKSLDWNPMEISSITTNSTSTTTSMTTSSSTTSKGLNFPYDTCLLDPSEECQMKYDQYMRIYADLLYRWGAMNVRCEVLKHLSKSGQQHRGLSLEVLCTTCKKPADSLYCSGCRDFAMRCSICQLVVRGQSTFCMSCGHGGHIHHIQDWFITQIHCPTGCGCYCKQANSDVRVRLTEGEENALRLNMMLKI